MYQAASNSGFLYYQPHPLHSPSVLAAGGDNVNPSSVYAAVPQNVRKLCDVLLNAVKSPGEQVPQIVRKHLPGIYPCHFAQAFHLTPDVGAT